MFVVVPLLYQRDKTSSLYFVFFVRCRPSPNTVNVAITADR
ncbi:hypothetical protein SLEP1_g48921 [Rubroshorea leprosula]|uniref:Uncharacterized protein n=1 Tax=Rubroshorea leprosula TaxID=152421 RepID=A0AAV5LV73_9ROSI|nr:hypothetical protein SLEP1_g48921 [Rubroshorea leprosula]